MSVSSRCALFFVKDLCVRSICISSIFILVSSCNKVFIFSLNPCSISSSCSRSISFSQSVTVAVMASSFYTMFNVRAWAPTARAFRHIRLITPMCQIVDFAYGLLIPSHWNARGEIDDWSSKNFSVLFFPSITLGVYLLMTFVPLIDPLRKNYANFATPYFWFRTLFVLFFVLIYFYTLWSATGTEVGINYFMIPSFSVLFILIGLFLPKIKKNYFVGIRTPWTIHSEEVWDRTHRLSGKLFIIAGGVALLSLFIPKYSYPIFITAVLSATVISVISAYFIFRKVGGFE